LRKYFILIFYYLNCYKSGWEKSETVSVCEVLDNQTMLNIKFGTAAIGAAAAAALLCGSGSSKMMRLLAAPPQAPHHCFSVI
jgi:hypothetical protein